MKRWGLWFATLLRVPHVRVSIISGGDWPQFETQVLGQSPAGRGVCRSSRCYPTNGTRCFYRYAGSWSQLYAENLSDAQRSEDLRRAQ